MLKLHDKLLCDVIYEQLPIRVEYWELATLIDTVPGLTPAMRYQMNALLAALYCDTIDDAFALGWMARTDPTFLIFEQTKGGE